MSPDPKLYNTISQPSLYVESPTNDHLTIILAINIRDSYKLIHSISGKLQPIFLRLIPLFVTNITKIKPFVNWL